MKRTRNGYFPFFWHLVLGIICFVVFLAVFTFGEAFPDKYNDSFRSGMTLALKKAIVDESFLSGWISQEENEKVAKMENELISEFSKQKVSEFDNYLNKLIGIPYKTDYSLRLNSNAFITGYLIQVEKDRIEMGYSSGSIEEQDYRNFKDAYNKLVFKDIITKKDVKEYANKTKGIVLDGRPTGIANFAIPILV